MTKGEAFVSKEKLYLGNTGWTDNDGTKLDTMVWVYVDNWKGDGRMKHTKDVEVEPCENASGTYILC
jgi:hypothetical protein